MAAGWRCNHAFVACPSILSTTTNNYDYLNHIPFADHGALLDPPTSDVTARCIGMLAQLDSDAFAEPIRRGIDFLKSEQETDGSWFGRWVRARVCVRRADVLWPVLLS